MRKAGCRIVLLFCAVLLWIGGCGIASAQTDGSPETDTGRAWLDLLFRGVPLPGSATGESGLGAIVKALHSGLAIYNTGVLVLAGLLLFYALGVMIIETAHYGVPFGRRTAQVWAPIRLVLALGFLVPISGGLNVGQYLVVWMAKEGSSMASSIWSAAAGEMKGSFSAIAAPYGPDIPRFVVGGVEMELCRDLYGRLFASVSSDAVKQALGGIGDISARPPSRFAGETWLYGNRLQPDLALCGAYRFPLSHAAVGDASGSLAQLDNDLADFGRAETSSLIAASRTLAANDAGRAIDDTPDPGLRGQIAALIASHRASVAAGLRALTGDSSGAVGGTLAASAAQGWVSAGGFLLQLARRQDMYGTLAADMLPSVQGPLFAASEFMPVPLSKSISNEPGLQGLPSEDATLARAFYMQMERLAAHTHDWLYDRQLADLPLAFAGPFDLRARANGAASPQEISSFFSRSFDDAAIAYGVWSNPATDPGILQPVMALPEAGTNPIAALAEFGRRQAALGHYLFGLASPDVAPAGTLSYVLLTGLAGLGFIASGLALMFLIPFLPFFRFVLGILVWLLSVFEAVIAVPIVALAHINLSGEGLGGGAVRRAYILWLNVLIRPALLVFGFVIGFLLFAFAAAFLDLIFRQLLRLAAPDGSGLFATVDIALTFFYTLLACAAANAAFKGIDLLPGMALNWMGGFTVAAAHPAPVSSPAPAASAIAHASAAAMAKLSVSSYGERGGNDKIESRAMAAAKARGHTTTLFPQYGNDKGAAKDPPPTVATTESRTVISHSRETMRDASMPASKTARSLEKPGREGRAIPEETKADPVEDGEKPPDESETPSDSESGSP